MVFILSLTFCLNDLFASISCSNQRPYTHFKNKKNRFPDVFFLSPCFAQENSVPLASFELLRSSSTQSPLFEHLTFFLYDIKRHLRLIVLFFAAAALYCFFVVVVVVVVLAVEVVIVVVCCPCASVAKCSLARDWDLLQLRVRLLVDPSPSRFTLFVFAVCFSYKNAPQHIAVCVREYTASFSSYVSCKLLVVISSPRFTLSF